MSAAAANFVSDSASERFRYVSKVMPACLDHLNRKRQAKSLVYRNDYAGRPLYECDMAKPRHDWYLREWLKTLQKRQADIVRDMDWNKARVSLMIRGEQQYTRDAVNEMAAYLNLQPFELLMDPEDAMALRRLRTDLKRVAKEDLLDRENDGDDKKVSLG